MPPEPPLPLTRPRFCADRMEPTSWIHLTQQFSDRLIPLHHLEMTTEKIINYVFVNSFRMTTVLPFHNYKHKQQFYELCAEQKYFPKWKRNSTPPEPAVRTMALGLAQVLQISVRLQQETAGSQVGFCVQALVRCGFKYKGKHRLSQRGVWKRQEHISLT